MPTYSVQMTVFDIVRLLLLVINVVAIWFWMRRKVLLNYYLEGQWEGNLIDDEDRGFVISCIMSIVREKDRCTGLLYYEVRRDQVLLARGLDRLLEYRDRDIWPTAWKPTFQRVLHAVEKGGRFDETKIRYSYAFQVRSRLWKNQMSGQTTIEHNDRNLSGLWFRK